MSQRTIAIFGYNVVVTPTLPARCDAILVLLSRFHQQGLSSAIQLPVPAISHHRFVLVVFHFSISTHTHTHTHNATNVISFSTFPSRSRSPGTLSHIICEKFNQIVVFWYARPVECAISLFELDNVFGVYVCENCRQV